MPYFGQEQFLKAQAKGPLTSPAYKAAREKCLRLSRTEGIDATLTKHRVVAIVAPTGGPAWPTDLINGDHFTGGSSTAAAVSGYPSVTVPAGYVHGLPVGISFIGCAMERRDAHWAGVCLRAGDEGASAAALRADRQTLALSPQSLDRIAELGRAGARHLVEARWRPRAPRVDRHPSERCADTRFPGPPIHACCSTRTRLTVGGSATPSGVLDTRRSSSTSESNALIQRCVADGDVRVEARLLVGRRRDATPRRRHLALA